MAINPNSPEIEDTFLRNEQGGRSWLLQLSGKLLAVFFPQGFVDFFKRPVGDPPPAPIANRVRLWAEGDNFYYDTGSGPVVIAGGISRFIELLDTPASYAGQAGLVPVVNVAEDALEFGTVASSFLSLVDTPASYAGQAGLVAAVNAGETGLEFIPGGGGGGTSSSHHYSFPGVFYAVPVGGFSGSVYNGFIHWPGWTVADEVHWGNGLGAFLGFGTPSWRRTQDPTSLRMVTAARSRVSFEDIDGPTINIHRAIPGNFDDWDAEGISISHKVEYSAGVITTESFDLIAEVFDPTNAADVVVATVTRSVNASDAGYVELVIPQASLQSAGFVAGDLLRVRIRAANVGGFVGAVDDAFIWISRVLTAWTVTGAGGGGSVTGGGAKRLAVYGGYA